MNALFLCPLPSSPPSSVSEVSPLGTPRRGGALLQDLLSAAPPVEDLLAASLDVDSGLVELQQVDARSRTADVAEAPSITMAATVQQMAPGSGWGPTTSTRRDKV